MDSSQEPLAGGRIAGWLSLVESVARSASGFAIEHPLAASAGAVVFALALYVAGRLLRIALVLALVACLLAVLAVWATDSGIWRSRGVHAAAQEDGEVR